MTAKSQTVSFLAMIALWHLFGSATASEPRLSVVGKRADDKIEITSDEEVTTIAVRSPFGISNAIVKRSDDRWPERLILKLHLQSLEGLKLTNGSMEIVAEVAEPDGKRLLHLTNNSRRGTKPEATKLEGSDIRPFDRDGKSTNATPLKAGHFEVRLPKELFADNPESITINWIDFYR